MAYSRQGTALHGGITARWRSTLFLTLWVLLILMLSQCHTPTDVFTCNAVRMSEAAAVARTMAAHSAFCCAVLLLFSFAASGGGSMPGLAAACWACNSGVTKPEDIIQCHESYMRSSMLQMTAICCCHGAGPDSV